MPTKVKLNLGRDRWLFQFAGRRKSPASKGDMDSSTPAVTMTSFQAAMEVRGDKQYSAALSLSQNFKRNGLIHPAILVPLFNIAFACCVCKKLSDTSVIFVLQGQRSGCKRKASIHHAALACTNCFRFGKSQAAWAKLPTSAAWRHTVAQTPSFRPQNLSDGTLTNKRVETSDWQIGGPFMSLICQCQCSTHSHCGRRKCAIWFSKKQPLAATCQWLQVAASGCKWLQVAACGCLWLRGKWLQVAASRCKWLLVAAGQVAASGCGASDCKWRQVAASGCGPSGCLWLKVAASRCLWLRGKWLFFKTWSAKEWWHIARQFVANSVDQWQIL